MANSTNATIAAKVNAIKTAVKKWKVMKKMCLRFERPVIKIKCE